MSLALVPSAATASVAVTFTDVGVDFVTIVRSAGRDAIVRGADARATSGGVFYVVDDEAPFGVPIVYTAYDESGAEVASAATYLAVTGSWVKVPGRPDLSLPVLIGDHSRSDAYTTPQGVFAVINSPYPVVVSGTVSARVTSVSLVTLALTDAARMLAALTSAGVILVETPAGHQLERGYFAVGGFTRSQSERTLGDDASVWELPLTEVDIPAGGEPAGVIWDTINDTYASWTALTVGDPTWLTLLQAF